MKREEGTVTGVILTLLLAVILLGAAFYGGYAWQHGKYTDLQDEKASLQTKFNDLSKTSNNPQVNTDPQTYASKKGVKIKVYYPQKDAALTSPVAIVGEVPGNWSTEASFPITLTDSKGTVVAKGTGQLLGNWMTDQLVPFSAKLTYTGAATGEGMLTLTKDNPSGIEANADSLSIPVKL
jgi:hypothetical protein